MAIPTNLRRPFQLLSIALLAAATAALQACNDSCTYALDGACDEPVLCANGTDTTDCQGSPNGCTNTCEYADDGECDDGRPGAQTSLCGAGTDCNDCGS